MRAAQRLLVTVDVVTANFLVYRISLRSIGMLNTAANTSSIVRSVAGALQVFRFPGPGGLGRGRWETGNSAFLNARRTADMNPALCAFKFFDLQGISPGGLPCHLFSWMPRLALTSFACRPSLVF